MTTLIAGVWEHTLSVGSVAVARETVAALRSRSCAVVPRHGPSVERPALVAAGVDRLLWSVVPRKRRRAQVCPMLVARAF